MDEPDDPREEDPLEEEDRDQLQQDLVDVKALKALLGARGIKGAVFFCPDCEEDHFLTWDLLHGNLEAILEDGSSPIHEPAFAPDPDDYVSWDYARGFLDGYESFEDEEMSEMAMRLVLDLRDRGWRIDEIKSLTAGLGLEFPPIDESRWGDLA